MGSAWGNTKGSSAGRLLSNYNQSNVTIRSRTDEFEDDNIRMRLKLKCRITANLKRDYIINHMFTNLLEDITEQ